MRQLKLQTYLAKLTLNKYLGPHKVSFVCTPTWLTVGAKYSTWYKQPKRRWQIYELKN